MKHLMKSTKVQKMLTIAVLLMALSGCATILSGSQQQISVNSNIKGATVLLNGRQIGETPLVAMVPKGNDQVLTVRAPGCSDQTIAMHSGVAGTFWINILTGGLPGSTTDLASGAIWEFQPSSFYATMGKGSADSGQGQRDVVAAARFVGFTLHTYPALTKQLLAGQGPHATACCTLMEVEAAECDSTVRELGALALHHDNPVTFAHAVVAKHWPTALSH